MGVSKWIVGITGGLVVVTTLVWVWVFETMAIVVQPVGEKGGVIKVESEYKKVANKPTGEFRSGQAADLMLSGWGFNQSGGPLFFHHPGELATDGTKLIMADRNNNRVLIWNKLPSGNTAPDLVLGQENFETNNPGTGSNEMNWPVGVSLGGGKLAVADAYNERVLIWKEMPTKNGQAADVILENLRWPWGVWTDGQKLAVASTQEARVLIWNSFPVSNEQPPEVILTANGKMGTPRGITSNGEYLIVGDHNAKVITESKGGPGGGSATFFWKSWPKADRAADFWIPGWRTGTFLPDNKLALLSTTHYPPSIWNQLPVDDNDGPDLEIGWQGPRGMGGGGRGYNFDTGDGSDMVWAGNRLYISLSNGNKIVGYNQIPSSTGQEPDFVIGAGDIDESTLEENFIITNGVVASDGQSLFASSDFDRKLYVWKDLPDEGGAKPDFVYNLDDAPWDNALFGQTLVLAGKSSVYVWKKLPIKGEEADLILRRRIGSVELNELVGVAMDDKYFYLADSENIYVWEGIPTATSEPKFTLAGVGPGRLDSDGIYLAGTVNHNREVGIWEVSNLSNGSKPRKVPMVPNNRSLSFNLPGSVMIKDGHLFVADTVNNRVFMWKDMRAALTGKTADVVLGEDNFEDVRPEIGINKLFWPASMAFDGSYLWVGEFKFSDRILRFSVGR